MKKSGISIERAIKLQTRFISEVAATYSLAEVLHMTHEDVLERLGERVYNQADWKKMPTHAKEYVRGYIKARADEHYKYHLVWMLSLDGKLWTSQEVQLQSDWESLHPELHTQTLSPWQRVKSELSRHVWKDTNGKPVRNHPYDKRFLDMKTVVGQLTYLPFLNQPF